MAQRTTKYYNNMRQYVEAVLRELTNEQKNSIRETDKEYVVFRVSVFNTGANIKLEFTNDMPMLSDEDYNDFILESQNAVNCLNQLI